MVSPEVQAENLMVHRRIRSMVGAMVQVARSMRDTMQDSTAATTEEEGFQPIFAPPS
jgi:hypothetical protein